MVRSIAWVALLLLHVSCCKAQSTDSLNLLFEQWELNDQPIRESYLIKAITDLPLDEIPRGTTIGWTTHERFAFQSPEARSGDYALGLYSSGSFNPFTFFGLHSPEFESGCPVDFEPSPLFSNINTGCIRWKIPVVQVSGYMKKTGTASSMQDTVIALAEAAIQDSLSGEPVIVGRGLLRFLPSGEYEKFQLDIQYDTDVEAIDFFKLAFFHNNSDFTGTPAFVEHIDDLSFELATSTVEPQLQDVSDCYQLLPNLAEQHKEIQLVKTCEQSHAFQDLFVVDISGRLMQHHLIDDRETILQTAVLPSGIYRVLLQSTTGKIASLPLVIQ
ncbi:MAG: hypothetical protein AAFV95_17695 [Bacteroidota bacterium]